MARVVRPVDRSGRLIALACVALLRGAPMAAQTTSDYRSLVERYATSDDPGTMTALARWSRPVVTDAVNFWAPKLTPQELIAAVMLHTDLASSVIDETPSLASFHVGTARRLLDALIAGDLRHERALAVRPPKMTCAISRTCFWAPSRNATRS